MGTTITFPGLTLGETDEFGTKWTIRGFDGWGATGTTLDVQQRARASGGVAGDSFSKGRTCSIQLLVRSVTAEQHVADMDRLISATPRDPVQMIVAEPGITRWALMARSDEIPPARVNAWTSNVAVQVASEDWRKFGDAVSDSTLLPATSGGLTVPFTVPFTIASTVVNGQVSLTNPGNEVGPVVLRIDGPCAGPVITHVSTGLQLVFSSSLVLGVGEWLDVDMEAHTVLANGQSSRSGWVTSRGWSGFDPGVNSWAFAAAAYDPAARLTVTATPAWE